MIVQAAGTGVLQAGIRPIRLPYDLLQLADLLETAFGDELTMADSRMVADMRHAARLGTLMWMAGGSRLGGYVYTEGSRILGNISVAQSPHDKSSWFICNVAVQPEHRGRGIASRLLDTALYEIRRQHGRWVALQVRTDNPVALGLYQRRGFVTYDTTRELKLAGRRLQTEALQADSRLRALRSGDSRALIRLVWETSAPLLLAQRQIRAADYRRTWWGMLDRTLANWLNGSTQLDLVGYCNQRLAAYGALRADSASSPWYAELRVAHNQRGAWEAGLASQLLGQAAALPHRNVHASISLAHPEALEALEALGFTCQRTLANMGLVIR